MCIKAIFLSPGSKTGDYDFATGVFILQYLLQRTRQVSSLSQIDGLQNDRPGIILNLTYLFPQLVLLLSLCFSHVFSSVPGIDRTHQKETA